ncbi:hypothetical protein [Candidatus Parabeggiatoa sp. HSG14]|uniref:hypothetical protein n=1 Tax=Candidatus Parabeggiatoa sp. HSG14 TaxID=3055593 RepID=UPI0025A71CD1|nr:hypothetical protein [Thiotrichales bacterium HSG14]
MMHDFPRQKLRELIEHHGTNLSFDAKRCESFLRDACGGKYKREVFVLINAIKEGVPKSLLNPPAILPQAALLKRLAQRLHDDLGLDKTLAEWTIETWAVALSQISPSQISPTQVTKLQSQQSNIYPIKKIQQLAIILNQANQWITKQTGGTVTQPIVSSQYSTLSMAKPLKPLSPLNPFDHLRLLWWVLVMPQQLQIYRQFFGEVDEKHVGKLLVNTLTWWPFFVPTLALGVELLPHFTEAILHPEAYLLISTLLVGCWLIMGWLGNIGIKRTANIVIGIIAGLVAGIVAVVIAVESTSIIAGIIAGIMAGVLAGGVAFGGITGGISGVVGGIASVMAGLIVGGRAGSAMVGMVSVVAISVALGMTSIVAVGVSNGMAGGVVGGALGGVTVVVMIVIAVGIAGGAGDSVFISLLVITPIVVTMLAISVGRVIENSLKTGTPLLRARLAFLLLITTNLFLIGLYTGLLNL